MDEQSPPVDVSGNASPAFEHPFAMPQLSTSPVPGKQRLSTADRDDAVVVDWNKVVDPDTRSAGSEASCSSDGGEFEVDSDSQGLALTSFDNLEEVIGCVSSMNKC